MKIIAAEVLASDIITVITVTGAIISILSFTWKVSRWTIRIKERVINNIDKKTITNNSVLKRLRIDFWLPPVFALITISSILFIRPEMNWEMVTIMCLMIGILFSSGMMYLLARFIDRILNALNS